MEKLVNHAVQTLAPSLTQHMFGVAHRQSPSQLVQHTFDECGVFNQPFTLLPTCLPSITLGFYSSQPVDSLVLSLARAVIIQFPFILLLESILTKQLSSLTHLTFGGWFKQAGPALPHSPSLLNPFHPSCPPRFYSPLQFQQFPPIHSNSFDSSI